MDRQTSSELVVRRMPFEFPADLEPHWNAHEPEWSHMVNGASLAMPYLEPYLIRTMKKALPKLECEELKKEVKSYMAQEGQHSKQHRRFNDILIASGYSGLVKIEEQMNMEFADFEAKKSLKFNLAYACGFESMALGIGHWLVRDREFLFGGSDTRVASLILWHFVEEVEHKNVAFDAYQALYGNYFYRVFGTIFATLHVMKFSRMAYQSMLKEDGLWQNWKSRWRLFRMICRFFKSMVPPMLSACRPGHHPSQVSDPKWYLEWVATYEKDQSSVVVLDTNNLQASFS